MKVIKRFATHFQISMLAIALLCIGSSSALARNGHSNTETSQQTGLTQDQKNLVKVVRESTAGFQDVAAAKNAGYALLFGCVTGPDAGAMGLHFVNGAILDEVNKTGVFDATRPQIVLYEPSANGNLRLTGADFVVFAAQWDALHPNDPPQLLGQRFHFFESPNRFGLPAFYTLHVWAWKDNPNGAFVNWHPNVACEQFVGSTTK